MEFRPSPRDVVDAFELRIRTDNEYVLNCLMECGLDPAIRDYHYAQKEILKDFREHFEPIMDGESFDVTETFSRFVDEKGRYHRNSPDKYKGSMAIELGEDESYDVFTHRVTMDVDTWMEEEFSQHEFNNRGIEMKSTTRVHTVDKDEQRGEDNMTITSVRNDDMVTYTSTYTDGEGRVLEERPLLVSAHYPESHRLDFGQSTKQFSDKELPIIMDYIAKRSGLSLYVDHVAQNRKKMDIIEK